MDLNLAGKRALVGGASQGLGAACARQLALQGAEVIVLARSEDKLSEVVEQLPTAEGQRHGYICVDSADLPALARAVQAEVERGGPICVWVNNTGGPAPGPAHAAAPENYAAAFNQHLLSSQTLLELLLPGMRECGYGRIINVLSTSVKTPIANLGVSNAIRAAMANWAKTLASELASDGITVNNVLPGLTRTARLESLFSYRASVSGKTEQEVERDLLQGVPARRFAEPEEFANAVGFLASPAAAFINGINLPVDGGATASL
ncbi:3-oxoacyl-[acyl-carrier protein] reductase [Halopseudomonas litoralis]|uniref:3-oxoacyl-[acyl-carrier protein] reductase n=1 Tax=Halopseudomonas litoralis TaxID=797277 RepID=A0A1H1PI72_9GAMM|nr:SDR family oxidoreductase [Halopseudomonas litoralis]SDS10780.1 3-oxoacyl-[acyl-carrier protein] reductase [Halopseudomonas litoralis]